MGFLKSVEETHVPSGNLLHKYGKIHHSMGNFTISMIMFNSYVTNYQRVMVEA